MPRHGEGVPVAKLLSDDVFINDRGAFLLSSLFFCPEAFTIRLAVFLIVWKTCFPLTLKG